MWRLTALAIEDPPMTIDKPRITIYLATRRPLRELIHLLRTDRPTQAGALVLLEWR